jgi:hypothetical protein
MNRSHLDAPLGQFRLWIAALVPVFAWALHLFTSYAFVEWYCRYAAQFDAELVTVGLNTIFVISLLIGVSGCVLCYRNRKVITQSSLESGRSGSGRGLFVSNAGLLLGLFMVAFILVQWLPGLMVPPCS